MSKLESGSILEIPLSDNFGFGYGKFIDVSHIIGRTFDSNIIHVYDFISKESIASIDLLRNTDLLFGPQILAGRPRTRGEGKWRIIGKDLNDRDFLIPDFKYIYKFPGIVEDESKIGPWYRFRKMGTIMNQVNYDQVRHLEQPRLKSMHGIAVRVVMEALRKEQKDPTQIITDAPQHIKDEYLLMINVPIYSSIPKEIRGKGIES